MPNVVLFFAMLEAMRNAVWEDVIISRFTLSTSWHAIKQLSISRSRIHGIHECFSRQDSFKF